MSEIQTNTAVQASTGLELTHAKKPLLMEQMAAQYGMEPGAFKAVLLKTVFPQDKLVSMEQLAMFCIVAHKYSLNPLTREIYAFPAKGGGIVPIVGYDGWISLLQRQDDYDGLEYEYIWKDNQVGGECIGLTCVIYRRKHSRPTKKTVWMAECRRGTDQWNQKPIWMLEIKGLIQATRLAYGFGGIYDPDEGERILEATLKATPDGNYGSEIALPQRVQTVPQITVQQGPPTQTFTATSGFVVAGTTTVPTYTVVQGETRAFEPELRAATEEDAAAEAPEADSDVRNPNTLQGLFDAGLVHRGVPNPSNVIGRGRAQRLYAILGKHKIHTEEEVKAEFLRPMGLEHLTDMPLDIYEKVCAWAAGKLEDQG